MLLPPAPTLQVFMPWEGVAAQRSGVELNAFKLSDYDIPYGYSPVLAAHPQTLAQNPDLARAFLAATARGYDYAAQHPDEAAELLCAEVAADVEKVNASDARASQYCAAAAGQPR